MSRREKKTERLYSCQNYLMRFVTPSEAQDLVDRGVAEEITLRNTSGRKTGSAFKMLELDRAEKHSAASITKSECEANAAVGFPEASRTALMSEEKKLERERRGLPAEDFVEAAMLKVVSWPFVGDDKAVRVGPRVPTLAAAH